MFLHPIGYAETYDVQYPSLTVSVCPPVFFIVEALFFAVLGGSHLAAKLTILLFTLCAANMFFLMCRLWFSSGLSVVAWILCTLQPVMLFAQKNVMLELPALAMSITSRYCLCLGTERRSCRALFFSPLFAAIAFLTKQDCVFLVPVSLIWIMWDGKWEVMKSRAFMCGVVIGTIMLLPWLNLGFTIVSTHIVHLGFSILNIWPNKAYYARHLPDTLPYAIVFLAILSFALLAELKECKGPRLAWLWSGSVLLFTLPPGLAEPRHALPMVPAAVILAC